MRCRILLLWRREQGCEMQDIATLLNNLTDDVNAQVFVTNFRPFLLFDETFRHIKLHKSVISRGSYSTN